MQMDIHNGVTLPSPPNAARRISPLSKGHFSGHLIVGEGAGQVMEVESHLEMEIALLFSTRANVADLENQVPFRWRCPDDEKWKTHFFDFRVHKFDGTRTAIMVKKSKKLACPKFQELARQIASQVTTDFADDVTIMTERDIDPVEIHNATFLHGLKEADPDADTAVRRIVSNTIGATTIGDIVSSVGLGGRGFRAVGRLLRKHELKLADRVRITRDARVLREAA